VLEVFGGVARRILRRLALAGTAATTVGRLHVATTAAIGRRLHGSELLLEHCEARGRVGTGRRFGRRIGEELLVVEDRHVLLAHLIEREGHVVEEHRVPREPIRLFELLDRLVELLLVEEFLAGDEGLLGLLHLLGRRRWRRGRFLVVAFGRIARLREGSVRGDNRDEKDHDQ
jgi:hypothetical protein